MPKVSVIIPVYNVEEYLRECLDSVVNQTLKDIEIICVNDGSTDSSRDILQEYADKDNRIKIIDKKNGGISSARNLGMKASLGEFIGFLDSDDWIDLNFYEKLYDAAIKYNADIASASLLRVYSHKKTYYLKHRNYKCSNKPRLKYEYAKIPDNCYVINRIYNRKKLQKTGILFEEGILYEDIEFSHIVIYCFDKLVTVPGTNYYYRNNPYSIVNIKSEKSTFNYEYAMSKALDFVQKNNIIWKRLYKYPYTSKKSYHLFCLPLLTIKTYNNYKRYILFNTINIFDVKDNKKMSRSNLCQKSQ